MKTETYNIMVVDDDPLVLETMERLFKKYFPRINNLALMSSGIEAIQKLNQFRPDIVFMDIKMPGLDGLETIEEIKETYKDAKFVIISAYQQFDFAKQAIALDVVDYLLKPIDKDMILNCMKKAIRLIENERSMKKMEIEYKDRLNKVIPFLESQFLYSILFNQIQDKEICCYQDILNVSLDCGCIVIVELEDSEWQNYESQRKTRLKFYDILKYSSKKVCNCLVGPLMTNRVIIYIPAKKDEHIFDICQKVMKAVSSGEKYPTRIGIGNVYQGRSNIYTSFEEALKALRYTSNDEIISFLDVSMPSRAKVNYPICKEKLFIDAVKKGDKEKSIAIFSEILNWLDSTYDHSIEKIKRGLVQIIVLMFRILADLTIEGGNKLIQDQQYLHSFFEIADYRHLVTWCKDKIELVCNLVIHFRQNDFGDILKKALQYIQTSYSKDITLEQVAHHISLNPTYFSSMFHKKTGKKFSDYLIYIRIEKAKQLLEDTDLTIKQISFKIGYKSPNYFSRIFKKVTNLSPTNYRAGIKVDSDF